MSLEFDESLCKDSLADFLGSKLSVSDNKAFMKFSANLASKKLVDLVIVSSILSVLYCYILALLFSSKDEKNPLITALLIVVFFLIPIFTSLFYLRRLNPYHPNGEYLRSWIPFLVNYLPLVSITSIGCFLLTRVYNGQCNSALHFHSWSCNPEQDSQALPQELIVILMISPILYTTVLKHLQFEFILASWVLVVLFLAAAVWVGDDQRSIVAIMAYTPLSAVILFETHRQNLILFTVVQKQKQLLVENQQINETTATELRHMIANVAHDLKTPLSAFMSGVESIGSLLQTIDSRRVVFDKKYLPINVEFDPQPDLSHIRDNLRNLINTNDFMLMTINRCIDYTKASKGIKLEPRHETVSLGDILMLPIQVMKDMQSRTAVNLMPLPSAVCSHVITDKQWLQENLFCLISNAVKFSSNGGTANIGVSLTCVDFLPTGAKREVRPVRGMSTLSVDSKSQVSESSPRTKKPSPHSLLNRAFSGRVHVTNDMDIVVIDTSRTLPTSPLASSGASSSEVLLFEVEDTGIGLSDEMMNNLFTPFKQAQRRAGGTGLGLYSLAKRIEALNGYYGVQRRKDGREGSLFWFAIPYTPDRTSQGMGLNMKSSSTDERDVMTSRKVSSGLVIPPSVPQKLNILIVDDSLTILKMSSMLLKRQGHTVNQAENGAEALKKIAAASSGELDSEGNPQIPFDIVLMDFNMPVMDGLEATTRLRARESADVNLRHQFVVGFSANSDHDTMLEGMAVGMDDFISKPFALQTFYNVYRKYKIPLNQ